MAITPDPFAADPIAKLVRWRFPELNATTPEGVAFRQLPTAEQKTKQDEIEAFRQLLANLPDDKLKHVIAEARRLSELRVQKFREAQLAKPFYERITADMDLVHWSTTAYWTIDEATALSFGKDPRQVSQSKLQAMRQPTSFSLAYAARLDILQRAYAVRELLQKTRLEHFLPWIERMQFPMPEELMKAAKALHGPKLDWEAKYYELKTEMAKLAEETRGIFSGAAAGAIANSNAASLSAKERESLLKLVIGMAIRGYGHEPFKSRTNTASEIAGDLSLLGIQLSDDTIRSYLQKARELLPPPETEQKS